MNNSEYVNPLYTGESDMVPRSEAHGGLDFPENRRRKTPSAIQQGHSKTHNCGFPVTENRKIRKSPITGKDYNLYTTARNSDTDTPDSPIELNPTLKSTEENSPFTGEIEEIVECIPMLWNPTLESIEVDSPFNYENEDISKSIFNQNTCPNLSLNSSSEYALSKTDETVEVVPESISDLQNGSQIAPCSDKNEIFEGIPENTFDTKNKQENASEPQQKEQEIMSGLSDKAIEDALKSYEDIELAGYNEMYDCFNRFRKMVIQMKKKDEKSPGIFKALLKQMARHCRVEEKNIKSKILEGMGYSSDNKEFYTQHLNTAVVLSDDIVDLIADVISGNSNTIVKIEKTTEISSKGLHEHWKHTMQFISSLWKFFNDEIPDLHKLRFNTKALMTNDAFLALIQDSVARLDSDLILKARLFNSKSLENGFLNNYLSLTSEIFTNLEQKLEQGGYSIQKGAEKATYIPGFAFKPFSDSLGKMFVRLERFINAKQNIKEVDVFVVMMLTRCRILYETHFTIVKLFFPNMITSKRTIKEGNLPFLILYSFLDFRKVEKFYDIFYSSSQL